jgi:hypothetical protein
MRVWKFLYVLCGVLFFLLFPLELFVDAYYHDHRPAGPQPAQGRIYATELSKGAVVYLTKKEKLIYQLRTPVALTSILIAVLLTYWKQKASEKKMKL